MARARGARSGAALPARARLQGGGAPPHRPAPRLAPRHAPPGSPRVLGAARAGPPLPHAGGTRPRPPPPGSAARRAPRRRRGWRREGRGRDTEGPRGGRGGRGKERPRRRRWVFSRPVAAAAATGRAALHGADCAPLSLRRSLLLLLPAATVCSRAPCPSARRQPQQQRRRRRLLQAPKRRLHIARRAARRAPSCLPRSGSSRSPGRRTPHPATPPRASGRAPSPRPGPAPDARGHLFAAPARDSPAPGSPQRRAGGAVGLNPCAAARTGRRRAARGRGRRPPQGVAPPPGAHLGCGLVLTSEPRPAPPRPRPPPGAARPGRRRRRLPRRAAR